jgi:hypothetical protein
LHACGQGTIPELDINIQGLDYFAMKEIRTHTKGAGSHGWREILQRENRFV